MSLACLVFMRSFQLLDLSFKTKIFISTIPHSTYSSHLCLLPQQFVFDRSLFFFSHPFLMFFEVFPFPGLEVEPCVGEGTDLGQQSLNERMELILHDRQTDINVNTHIYCTVHTTISNQTNFNYIKVGTNFLSQYLLHGLYFPSSILA